MSQAGAADPNRPVSKADSRKASNVTAPPKTGESIVVLFSTSHCFEVLKLVW